MRGTRAPATRERDAGAEVPGDPDQPLGDPESAARIICLRLLERRARTRAELADALARRGIPDEAGAQVLDRFVEVGLIDDAELAHQLTAAQHRERGLARRAVAAKLRSRGVEDDVIAEAVTTIAPADERARAEDLVRRRRPRVAGLPAQVQVRRLVGMLARKGYPSGLAFEVVREALREVSDDDALGLSTGAAEPGPPDA